MSGRNKAALAFLGGVTIFLLVMQTPVLREFKGRLWQGWIVSVGDWFRVGSLSIDDSVDEQLNRLTAENVRLKAELRDFKQIRDQIGSVGFDDYEKVAIRLSPMPLDPFQVTFMANKGSIDGVQLNAPVVIDGSILIGFVSDLEEYSAVIRLVFHPETSLAGEVLLDEDVAKGLISGDSFTGVKITKIPRDIKIAEDGEVVTSEVTDVIPGGIMIGRISRIANEQYEPYQQGKLTVPYRSSELRAAVILTSP